MREACLVEASARRGARLIDYCEGNALGAIDSRRADGLEPAAHESPASLLVGARALQTIEILEGHIARHVLT
jgi:hypothetical protein